jgi:hypothetical protein
MPVKSKSAAAVVSAEIRAYNKSQTNSDKEICDLLAETITAQLKGAENKIWHAHPVWFIDSKLKDSVRLLFWSGQTFEEEGLSPEGKFKAAEARYTSIDEVKVTALKRWLKKSIAIQWDYKNIVKRRGVLERLK